MSQVRKQLRIKTSMLRRLRKEFQSYQKEAEQFQIKIQQMEVELPYALEIQAAEIEIRKNNEFLLQCQSVLTNVRQKFIEAFEGLATFLNQKGQQQGINETQQKGTAQNLLLEVQTFLQTLGE